ncbi:acyl--CoA ligase [Sphingomonas sp. PL-96]|uniref:class I adenylate-forming enzyme family protein n=1 Tax=Sphingomonas sp. PL-96 TaxID=2887201 RepID=UPI001E47D74E|nr:class I adenylate-forming enzyme family protein [Sphingomonas sp. PL-96]MCC2975794.1 acyl--CoA ligase [Sphingomonas sp. PL-96]
MAPHQPSDPSNGTVWPACTLAEATARLTAPGARFEMETVAIRGVPTRTWKHAPESLAALARESRVHGDRLFLIHEDDRVTFAASYRAVTILAVELAARGITKGDRVAIAMRNRPQWPIALLAIASLGAIAVPLNAWWTGAELAFALADTGARLLIADARRHERLLDRYADLPALEAVLVSGWRERLTGNAEPLEALIGSPNDWARLPELPFPEVDIAPDDPVTIFYTSGTTGGPKGAVGTHRNLMSNILSSAYVSARTLLRRGVPLPERSPPQTVLLPIPLFHVTACSAFLMIAIATGGTVVLMRKWAPAEAMALIARERIEAIGAVPAIAWQLLEHPDRHSHDLASLVRIAYGGAPAAPELARRIQAEFGAMPSNGWGMTETMATVASNAAEDYLARPTSCGPPVATADLKILAPDTGAPVPAGEVGELWARGPMVVQGYWNRPEATAASFVDGWVRTGDLARIDTDGFCHIVDRLKDVVIRGGENIYAAEVEDVLYAHPAVTDCALVGVPHRTLGEEPAAVVHLAPDTNADAAELQAWVRARLAAFKVPVAIRFSEATLPRNANGKILKRDLRALFAPES